MSIRDKIAAFEKAKNDSQKPEYQDFKSRQQGLSASGQFPKAKYPNSMANSQQFPDHTNNPLFATQPLQHQMDFIQVDHEALEGNPKGQPAPAKEIVNQDPKVDQPSQPPQKEGASTTERNTQQIMNSQQLPNLHCGSSVYKSQIVNSDSEEEPVEKTTPEQQLHQPQVITQESPQDKFSIREPQSQQWTESVQNREEGEQLDAQQQAVMVNSLRATPCIFKSYKEVIKQISSDSESDVEVIQAKSDQSEQNLPESVQQNVVEQQSPQVRAQAERMNNTDWEETNEKPTQNQSEVQAEQQRGQSQAIEQKETKLEPKIQQVEAAEFDEDKKASKDRVNSESQGQLSLSGSHEAEESAQEVEESDTTPKIANCAKGIEKTLTIEEVLKSMKEPSPKEPQIVIQQIESDEGESEKPLEKQGKEKQEGDVARLVESDNSDIEEEQDKVLEVQETNHLLMSVFASKISNSLKHQQEQETSLHASFRANQQELMMSSKVIFMKNSAKAIVVREDEYFIVNLHKVIRIQRFFKKKAARKAYAKMLKQHKYRRNVIKEIIATEETYVRDLAIINDKLLQPLSKVPGLELEMKKIFNVDGIYRLNKELLNELLKMRATLDSQPYQQTMKVVIEFLPYFKLYYDYCKTYDSAAKLLDHYEKNSKVFQQKVVEIKNSNVLRGLDMNSFIVKPIQRLPKYILLYKDLLKHTDKDHPDYQNIEKCLNEFLKVNDVNNEEMGKYLCSLKLLELQQQFGGHLTIAEPTRRFKFEDACGYLKDDRTIISVILYAFNNMLLLAQQLEHGHQKYVVHINLNASAIVKDLEDSQYYAHLLGVFCIDTQINFACGSEENKEQLKEKFSSIIGELLAIRDDNKVRKTGGLEESGLQAIQQTQIIVKVVNTETRNTAQMKPYTLYTVQVIIDGFEKKFFVRYRQIADIEPIIKKYDPKLKIPHFSNMTWVNNQDLKVIDERRLMIERFLQIVLTSKQLMEHTEYRSKVLSALQLEAGFFDQPILRERQSIDSAQFMQNLLQSQFKQNVQPNQLQSLILTRQATKIIAAAQDINRATLIHCSSESDTVIGSGAKTCEYQSEIEIPGGMQLLVGFKKTTRIFSIKGAIADHIELQQCIDFRLFIGDSNDQFRVIDDQECLASILEANQIFEKKGFGQKLRNKFNKMFASEHKLKLVFKKYFYLTALQEEADLKKDLTRLRLISYEIFEEISQEKYMMSFNDYCVSAALYIMIQQFETHPEQMGISTFDPGVLNKVVPQKVLKTVKQTVWLEQIIRFIKQIEPQIHRLKEQNQEKNKAENRNLLTSPVQLTRLMFINNIKDNPLFGVTLYFVECPRETQKMIQERLKVKVEANIYIGMCYSSLGFYSPKDKKMIAGFGYSYVEGAKAFTSEFHCKIQGAALVFKSPIAFEMKQLVAQYREILQFTNQLKNN